MNLLVVAANIQGSKTNSTIFLNNGKFKIYAYFKNHLNILCFPAYSEFIKEILNLLSWNKRMPVK
ncbi:hypothetical protein HZS_6891 [Henneguya salminicola]|nr:hypothetical protein HZS_6891 [Henneguya salminicola]